MQGLFEIVVSDEIRVFYYKDEQAFLEEVKAITEGIKPTCQPKWESEIPKGDISYHPGRYLIRGELIIPQPVAVATAYVLPKAW